VWLSMILPVILTRSALSNRDRYALRQRLIYGLQWRRIVGPGWSEGVPATLIFTVA